MQERQKKQRILNFIKNNLEILLIFMKNAYFLRGEKMLSKKFIEFLFEGAHIQRWNDHIRPNGFTELDKQAHKMMILYILAKYEEQDHGAKLNWRALIEGGIFEFMHRIILTDIKPPIYHELMRVHGRKLNAWIYEQLARRVPELCPERGQWRIRRALLGPILRYGSVTALQQAVQPICKVLIQGQVNALGVGSIAAFNAVTRVDDFAFTPEQSIATAITTYIAQNRGARQPERIRRGFAVGLRLELGYWLLVGCVTLAFRGPILSLFVAGEGADEVIALGSRYLGYMALLYALPALTNSLQGFYRGMGKMTTTLIGTCLQAGLRAAAAAVLAPRVGLTGIAFACAFGWCVMLAFEIPYYFWTCKKQNLKKASPMGEAVREAD